jgi:hypothetical protein
MPTRSHRSSNIGLREVRALCCDGDRSTSMSASIPRIPSRITRRCRLGMQDAELHFSIKHLVLDSLLVPLQRICHLVLCPSEVERSDVVSTTHEMYQAMRSSLALARDNPLLQRCWIRVGLPFRIIQEETFYVWKTRNLEVPWHRFDVVVTCEAVMHIEGLNMLKDWIRLLYCAAESDPQRRIDFGSIFHRDVYVPNLAALNGAEASREQAGCSGRKLSHPG